MPSLTVPEKSCLLVEQKGPIKLLKNEEQRLWIVKKGKKTYPFKSSSWAEKRFERLTKINVIGGGDCHEN